MSKLILLILSISLNFVPVMMDAQPAPKLIEVASVGKQQPIGCKVAPKGNRLFISFPHHDPYQYGLVELKGGQPVPFPDAEWNRTDQQHPENHFVNVQDLWTDEQNNLWVLDSAPAGAAAVLSNNNQSNQGIFKLIQIDLHSNKVKRIYTFDDLPKDKSALNDVRVDHAHHLAYLSDPALCAIVVLDLNTAKSRIVLQHDKSTIADPDFKLHLDGKDVVDQQGKPFSSNVNGVALTTDNRYFYFRAINQTKLYRIETKYLADAGLPPQELSSKVEMVAETGVCHGMTADNQGNIYLSDSPDHAIQYVSPDGKVHMLVQDERIIWPDSMGVSPDGYLYFSCSQMNRLPKYNNGQDMTEYPYRIFKVKLP